jgi:hypothetical protein
VSSACRRSSWRGSSSKAIRAKPDAEPEGGLSDRAVIDRYVTRIIVRPVPSTSN